MQTEYRELGFDTLLAVASGIALAAYMLRVILDPLAAAAVGFALVLVGVLTLVPRQQRGTAAAIGFVAMAVAGIVVPRAVDSLRILPDGNELMIASVGSGVILLLTFALLRLTAFQDRHGHPA